MNFDGIFNLIDIVILGFGFYALYSAYVLKKEGKMYSVVTSGVGVWGPGMRVGTDSEIVLINLEFNGKDT